MPVRKTPSRSRAAKPRAAAATAKRRAGARPSIAPAGRLGPAAIRDMFARFAAANPEPRGELDYVNPYTLLIAVVLSAQATDFGVNKATKILFA
jgi:endonuclease-3